MKNKLNNVFLVLISTVFSFCCVSCEYFNIDEENENDIKKEELIVNFSVKESDNLPEFNKIPFPNNIYLNNNGTVNLPNPPEGSELYTQAVKDSLKNLDGFGLTTAIFFSVKGIPDLSTMPSTIEESKLKTGSLILLSDTGETIAFKAGFDYDGGHIGILPHKSLKENSTYVAVITNKLKDI